MREALLPVQLEQLPDGGYLATSEDLPGLIAQGRTVAETLEIAQDVARKLVESYIELGDELPSALSETSEVKIDLRIPVGVD